jgi:putative ABC transport system permease protein
VSQDVADANHWTIGTPVSITYPDGTSGRLTLDAIYERTDMTGDYLLSSVDWAEHAGKVVATVVLVNVQPGADVSSAQSTIAGMARSYGNTRVQTSGEYRATVADSFNTVLGLIYVMLALAIVIAVMGIANTMSLSVYERTRELGLLRAVGQTRRQARAMVRWESVIIAVFGTIGGLALGSFLAWTLVEATSSTALGRFSAPAVQLAVVLVVGALAGVVAAIRPARRAAKLDVLNAVASEI